MNIIKDDLGQAGTIIFILLGVFIIGIVYVLFGVVMNENQVVNNDLISNSSLTYSDERADSMTGIYDYFQYYPVYMLIIFAIYGIKKSIDKQSGEI